MPYFFPLASGGGFGFSASALPGSQCRPLPGFPAWLCLPGDIFAAFGGLRRVPVGSAPGGRGSCAGGVVGGLALRPCLVRAGCPARYAFNTHWRGVLAMAAKKIQKNFYAFLPNKYTGRFPGLGRLLGLLPGVAFGVSSVAALVAFWAAFFAVGSLYGGGVYSVLGGLYASIEKPRRGLPRRGWFLSGVDLGKLGGGSAHPLGLCSGLLALGVGLWKLGGLVGVVAAHSVKHTP